MDSHGCALRVLGGMCGLPFKCSKGVRRNVCIDMDVPWMYSHSVRKDVFSRVLRGMCR